MIFLVTGLFLVTIQIVISFRINGISINGQDNLEQLEALNADVISIGSSRCLTSFMPRAFEKNGINICNLGLHGHSSLTFVEMRFNDYNFRNEESPQVVILNVDAFVSVKKEHKMFMKDRFARYAFFPETKDLKMLDYFGFNWSERFIPAFAMLKYRKIWDAIFLNNQSQWLTIGMETEAKSICNVENKFTDEAIKNVIRAKNCDNSLMKELSRLNIKFKKMGITLLAVQVPIFETIYNNRFAATQKICQVAGVPFIDFAIERYNKDCSLFKDMNHLNTKGARVISDSVARYIKTNMLIKSKKS
jgi:hypothetical protein